MGKLIEQVARDRNIHINSIIDPYSELATHKNITEESTIETDIAIDFSSPETIMQNIENYCNHKINAVIGTTGWYDHLAQVKDQVNDSGTKLLWASNFSIGLNIYSRIIKSAAKIINQFDEYDISGFEIHHHNKLDSPSATAKSLTNLLIENIERKSISVYDRLERQIQPNELHFASLRSGPINFEHTINFDSYVDTITIKHLCRDRTGYAKGAIQSALWLNNQKPGFYNIDDFIGGN